MDIDLLNQYQSVINYFGGQTKTAIALNLKQPSVNAWLRGASMSPVSALLVQKLSENKFQARDLCPQLAQIEGLIINYDQQTKTPAVT